MGISEDERFYRKNIADYPEYMSVNNEGQSVKLAQPLNPKVTAV